MKRRGRPPLTREERIRRALMPREHRRPRWTPVAMRETLEDTRQRLLLEGVQILNTKQE